MIRGHPPAGATVHQGQSGVHDMPGPYGNRPPVTGAVAGGGQWAARAAQRSPFWRLVAVEARKLVGTRSDKLVLAFSPIFLVGLMMLFTLTQSNLSSAGKQIGPLLIVVQLGLLLVFATVIKLVAGEWQYKSVRSSCSRS
jgi:hypothetical protein